MPSPYARVAIQLSPRLKRMLASMADVLAERATLSAPVVVPPRTPLDSPVCDATTPSPPQSANRQETLITAEFAPRRLCVPNESECTYCANSDPEVRPSCWYCGASHEYPVRTSRPSARLIVVPA